MRDVVSECPKFRKTPGTLPGKETAPYFNLRLR